MCGMRVLAFLGLLLGTRACLPYNEASLTVLNTGWIPTTGPLEIPANASVLLDQNMTFPLGLVVLGKLYVSAVTAVYIDLPFLVVRGNGEFHIGSEACPHPVKCDITLRTGPEYSNLGQKVFAVMDNAVLEMHGSKGTGANAWMHLASTIQPGMSSIMLEQAPIGWIPGDDIVIASTDFDPFHTETRRILSVADRNVTLDRALLFNHYGEVTPEGVDARAEVGLLSRNIVIHPDAVQYLSGGTVGVGGHLIAYQSFRAFHMEGVELRGMGQGDKIGRYPVHFHMIGSAAAGTYVKGCAIHHSNFRALTVHGTQNVLIAQNVAYDTYGHMYFLEDGSEFNNTFLGNLGLLARPKTTGAFLGSDLADGVSIYWITNPANAFLDNVAACTAGWGFFIHVRLAVRGLSAQSGKYASVRPYTIPLGKFSGNSVHSVRMCMEAESRAFDGGDFEPQSYPSLQANWGPQTLDGQPADTLIEWWRCHHATSAGSWTRGRGFIYRHSVWSDTQEGLQFGTTGSHPMTRFYHGTCTMDDALFVGQSANVGDRASSTFQVWDVATQRAMAPGSTNSIGFKMYDGPVILTGVRFVNFFHSGSGKDPNPPNSAFGVRVYNVFVMTTSTTVFNVTFINSPVRMFVSANPKQGGDGAIATSIRDADGSVSGYVGSTVIVPLGIYRTSTSVDHPAVGLIVPHRYANAEIVMIAGGAGPMTLTRNNVRLDGSALVTADRSLTFAGIDGQTFQPVVSIGASYLVAFATAPSRVVVQLDDADRADSVEFVFCFPRGSTVTALRRGQAEYGPSTLAAATLSLPATASRALALASQGSAYYFDSARGLLFVSVWQRATPASSNRAGRPFCPVAGCDFLDITVALGGSGATADTCNVAAYGNAADSILVTSGTWLDAALPSPIFVLPNISLNVPPSSNPTPGPPPPVAAECAVHNTCIAKANPNVNLGVSFLYYDTTCLSGGLACQGSTGCRFCELMPTSQNALACPACVCQFYGLAASRCLAAVSVPSPPPVSPPPPLSAPTPPAPTPPAPTPPAPAPPAPTPPAPTPPAPTPPAPAPAPAPASAIQTNCSIHSGCIAKANPNFNLGVSFLYYDTTCLSGGLACQGSTGCRFCELMPTSQNALACPACVCQFYGLAASRCLAAVPALPSPPPVPPVPVPPPVPPPPSQNSNCSTHSVCIAKANPNFNLGVSFLYYESTCLSGGLACQGSTGCRFCELIPKTSQNALACPACVCQFYGLASSRCATPLRSKHKTMKIAAVDRLIGLLPPANSSAGSGGSTGGHVARSVTGGSTVEIAAGVLRSYDGAIAAVQSRPPIKMDDVGVGHTGQPSLVVAAFALVVITARLIVLRLTTNMKVKEDCLSSIPI